MELNEKIRCYVIADDYRWHLLTDSLEEFQKATANYLKLMNESDKENSYYFKNLFLSREEYEQTLRIIAHQQRQAAAPLRLIKQKEERHLHLV